MFEPETNQPTTAAQALREEWFDTWHATELLAAAGGVELWRATNGSDGSALLRLYPRFRTEQAWRKFTAAAAERAKLDDPQLLPLAKLGTHGRPHLLLSDPVGEPLATRIEREPLEPELALDVFGDVAAALEALDRAGVGPVELTPAEVFLVAGERGLLLADTGLLRQVEGERSGEPPTTAVNMSHSFASVLQAALTGPADGDPNVTPAVDRLLTLALADRPPRGYRTPIQIVTEFRKATAPGRTQRTKPRAHLKAVPPELEPPSAPPAMPTVERLPDPPPPASLVQRAIATAAIVACVAVAAVLGASAGGEATPADPPSSARLVASDFSVEAPASWSRAGASAPFETGDDALVARPAADPTVGLAVTHSGDSLLASAGGIAPEAVGLRAGDAWRYPDVRIGERAADVYLLQTAAGPVIAACYGPATAGRAPLDRCGGVVSSLRVSGAEALPLGGEPAVRATVAKALDDLERGRVAGRLELANASSRAGQVAAAGAMIDAYGRAARAAGGPETVGLPGARTRLVAELTAAGRSYAALADAAAAGDRSAYDAARTRIAARERAVEQAIAPLRSTTVAVD